LEIGCVVSKAAINAGQLSDLAAARRSPRRHIRLGSEYLSSGGAERHLAHAVPLLHDHIISFDVAECA